MRWILLISLAMLVPSCGGSGGQDVFIDTFDAGLGAWTTVSGSVSIDSAGMGDGPAMRVTAQNGVAAEARTTAAFSGGDRYTVSASIDALSSTAEFGVIDAQESDESDSVVGAHGGGNDTFVRVHADGVEYSIQGQTIQGGGASDGFPHAYVFHVAGGIATWSQDGVLKAQGTFTPTTVILSCRDLSSGSLFDQIHISIP